MSACGWPGRRPGRMTPGRIRVLQAAEGGLVFPKRALAEAAGVSVAVIDGLVDEGTLETIAHRRPQPIAPRPDPDARPRRAGAGPAGGSGRARSGCRRAERSGVTLAGGRHRLRQDGGLFRGGCRSVRQGRQGLILMPEIALTAQFLERFARRFGVKPAEWHSGVAGRKRERSSRRWRPARPQWWRARARRCSCRSGISGLVIVDEEHESAYKQEDGVTLPRARHGGGARPDRECRRGAGLGHALHREPRQRRARPLPPLRLPVALRRPRDARSRGHRHARRTAPERGRWLSPTSVDAMRRDGGARRAGAAVPQPARLCAADAVPRLRPSLPVPELLGLAGGAPLPPRAGLPPLRPYRAHARGLPGMRHASTARRLRARRRADRRGGGRALSRRAHARALVATFPAARSGCGASWRRSRRASSTSSSARSSWPRGTISPCCRWSACVDADLGLASGDPARGRAHLPDPAAGDGPRRPRRHSRAGRCCRPSSRTTP